MYMTSHAEKAWLMNEIEKIPQTKFSADYKLKILQELAKV
jgi:2-oxoglutarate dehydrogenase complex dehydrogenase (E1) component-like enzyme